MLATASELLEHPELRTIAPLVLAAWEDEFLTPAELLAVRDALERVPGLNDAARTRLQRWLDPAAPPSAAALRDLARALAAVPQSSQRLAAAKSGSDDPFATLRELREFLQLQPRELTGASSRAVGAAVDASTAVHADEVARWRSALDGPQAAIRDSVRQLIASDERFRSFRDADMRAYREQVLVWCLAVSKLPWFESARAQPSGVQISQFLAAFASIAQFDLSLVVKFGVQFGLFAGAIQNLGTERHHALLPAITRGELIGCFAMTERGHGSNVRALRTLARYEPATREFVLQTPDLAAGKEWIGNAALHARSAVVFAQLETLGESYGVHAFLVPIRDERGEPLSGVRVEDCGQKMGLNGVDNGRLWFDGVRVPREALLDRFGQVAEDGAYSSPIPSPGKRFFTMLGTLVGGRINVAAGALAAAKVGLTIALRYGSQRRQFPDSRGLEQPVLDYLSHRQRLFPALARAYAFSLAEQELLALISDANQTPERGREIGSLAAGLKAVGTWVAIDTLQQCRECCGGQGYLTVNRIDALRTDTDVFATFEGDNVVLLQLVAKDLLRLYARELSEGPLRAILRSVGADVRSALRDRNFVAARRSDSDAVRDADFHLHALEFRERSLLQSLARRIKRRVDDGMPIQEAFEACQDHALALAKAYVERFALASFQKAATTHEGLRPLCALYGLDCLAADLTWFLENDYVAPSKSRAIRKETNALLAELAPRVLAYTEAFAIPETCLGPLADPEYLATSGLAGPATVQLQPDDSA